MAYACLQASKLPLAHTNRLSILFLAFRPFDKYVACLHAASIMPRGHLQDSSLPFGHSEEGFEGLA